MKALFAQQKLDRLLGEIVAEKGLKQLRIAETEKYAHVTFFMNGGEEREFPGEERILVPSPKVATYDMKPRLNRLTGVATVIVQGGQEPEYEILLDPAKMTQTAVTVPAVLDAVKRSNMIDSPGMISPTSRCPWAGSATNARKRPWTSK